MPTNCREEIYTVLFLHEFQRELVWEFTFQIGPPCTALCLFRGRSTRPIPAMINSAQTAESPKITIVTALKEAQKSRALYEGPGEK